MERILQTYLENAKNSGELVFFNNTDEIIQILDDINPEYLYKTNFHGLYHSQKVCFFAYLIGKHENLNEIDMKILLDAAKYHDIGRESDNEDNTHGYSSARLIDKIVKYENPTDMYLLKAIVEAHSKSDSVYDRVLMNWVLEKHDDDELYNRKTDDIDENRYIKLCNILKDADAIDRLRFKNCPAFLDENYLRIEYSKNLINLSKLINEYYSRCDAEEQYLIAKEKYDIETYNKSLCYHSIGFDLFKALGILKNGILSHYRAGKEGINLTRNFNGNNSEFWISVIDATTDGKNNKGYERYVKNGISFLCYANQLIPGIDRPKDNGSLEPRSSGEYPDEKFVFDKIPVEHIQFVSIPRRYMNVNVKDINYLYCNSNYETILKNINNYITEIEQYCDIRINRNNFDRLLNELKKVQLSFNSQDNHSKDEKSKLLEAIDEIKAELNKCIQEWMYIGFSELLGKTSDEEITLGEALKYILDSYNIEYSVIDNYEDEDSKILYMNFPYFQNDDACFLSLSTFDLTKKDNDENRTL